MAKIKAGDIVVCKEFISFGESENACHYEGQLIEVQPGEEYYFNQPCNRMRYSLDSKNQNALRSLYNGTMRGLSNNQ